MLDIVDLFAPRLRHVGPRVGLYSCMIRVFALLCRTLRGGLFLQKQNFSDFRSETSRLLRHA